MASRFVLHEVCRGQYRFTLVSHKGQVLLTSGLFLDKESALRKILITRHFARRSKHYVRCTAGDGSFYFLVKTLRGEALAYSAFYPDAESMQTALYLAAGSTPGARFEDRTQDPAGEERPVASGRFAALHA